MITNLVIINVCCLSGLQPCLGLHSLCDTKLTMGQCIPKMLERHNVNRSNNSALQQCHNRLSELGTNSHSAQMLMFDGDA